jgi:hypothetical protein
MNKGFLLLVILALAVIAPAQASVQTITDPYCGIGSCTPDIMGDAREFDIQKVVFNDRPLDGINPWIVTLYFNFDGAGNTGFNPFAVGPWLLKVGDLMFDVGSTYKYAVPVATHYDLANQDTHTGSSVQAGTMYELNPGGVLTSDQFNIFYGNHYNCSQYRCGEAVWADPNKIAGSGAPGTVNTIEQALTTTQTRYVTTLSFVPTANFINDYKNSAPMSVHFASATCANDIIDGHVPEPSVYAVLAGGLGLIIFMVRRKRAAQAQV